MEQRAKITKQVTTAILVTSFAYAFVNSIKTNSLSGRFYRRPND